MHVRVTGVVIEDGRILLVNQDTGSGRAWSLPGGKVEEDESLGGALVREMREETGIEVVAGRPLYVCDYLPGGIHVVHVTFEAKRTGGTVGDVTEGADTRPIRGVEFVKLADLPGLGFTEKFRQLAMAGFPGAGSTWGRSPTSASRTQRLDQNLAEGGERGTGPVGPQRAIRRITRSFSSLPTAMPDLI